MEISKEALRKLYTEMVRVRALDQKTIDCLFAGKLRTFFHSAQGQEAPGVALCAHLRQDDYVFYNHRGHGLNKCLPKGMPAKEILAEHFGKAGGGGRGFAGFHYSDMEKGLPGMGGMVGGETTLAAGVGIACQMRGRGQVVACCFGDGATGRGPLHEAMLMASAWKLPVIWFCENNLYAQWTCLTVSHPKEDLADFAHGYDIPSAVVDGQDVIAVYEAVGPAVERARAGKGPSFLEIKTYRYRPHAEGFPDFSVQCEGGVRPQQEVDSWMQRDPIDTYRKKLLEKGVLTEEDVQRIDGEAAAEMEEAERFSAESPWPDPKDFDKALYAD
jgi:acetoin:2,6-dichlorophenolindophenol oxidoreductase subunit alpha